MARTGPYHILMDIRFLRTNFLIGQPLTIIRRAEQEAEGRL